VSLFAAYVVPGRDEPVDGDAVSTSLGWKRWGDWVLTHADHFPGAAHLAQEAWLEGAPALDELEHELGKLLHEAPDPDRSAVTAQLLAALRSRPREAVGLLVTDGEPGDDEDESAVRESADASGHEHKGKGPGGGQFTSGGGGGQVSLPNRDTHRAAVPDPDTVTAAPKTKKGRQQLAASLKNAWLEWQHALADRHGTNDIDAEMTPEERHLSSHVFGALEVIATGREREGPHDLGPVSDQRYAGYYRGVVQALDKLRALAAGPKGGKVSEGAGPHKFASTHVELVGAAAAKILELGRRVRDEDLAEDGRETEPHVAVRYGLHDNDPAGVIRVLRNEPPVKLRLGGVSVFEVEKDGRRFDVVKADVASDDLIRLNRALAALPHTETYPYSPHATIAYVKAGLGAAYAGRFGGRLGEEVTCSRVTFGDTDGGRTVIPLAGSVAESGLVEKDVTVHRGGQTFTQKRKVRSGSDDDPSAPVQKVAGPPAEHVHDGLADKIAAADPEAAKNPGLVGKLKDKALTAAAKVYALMVRATPAAWKVMEVAGAVLDTPNDLKTKFGYNPTASSGTASGEAAAGGDPVRQQFGISAHLAATVASHVLSRVITWVRGKLGDRASEAAGDAFDEAGRVLAEVLKAIASEFGLSDPPAAEAIAEQLRSAQAR
jgi:hypothetical protein